MLIPSARSALELSIICLDLENLLKYLFLFYKCHFINDFSFPQIIALLFYVW